MFEMMSPAMPVVIAPQEDTLLLHGVRNVSSGQEFDAVAVAQHYGWKAVRVLRIDSADDAVRAGNCSPSLNARD